MSKTLIKIILNAEVEGLLWWPRSVGNMHETIIYDCNDFMSTNQWDGLKPALWEIINNTSFYSPCKLIKLSGEAIYKDDRNHFITIILHFNMNAKIFEAFTQ